MSHYYIVLDLEMNPISATFCRTSNGLKRETIEIGAIKIDAATNQIVDEFSCVVKPQFNHRIEPRITRLTGIRTGEVQSADSFGTALSGFVDWIGHDEAVIYSWSPCDHSQIKQECLAKQIAFPEELTNWIDFQAEYPKYLGYSRSRCFSLKDAADLIGTPFISGHAHRALYDAQVTAMLVLFALTGEYRHYTGKISAVMDRSQKSMTYSIGDACGSKLATLLMQMTTDKECEVSEYVQEFFGAAPTLVR